MNGRVERRGHTAKLRLVLLNSLKMRIRAKRGPSSRLSHCKRACNCHSSHTSTSTTPPPPLTIRSPTTHVKHRDGAQHSRQDHHLGIHAMLMALSFTSCQCLLMNPYINIQVCWCLFCRQTDRETDRETEWTWRQKQAWETNK